MQLVIQFTVNGFSFTGNQDNKTESERTSAKKDKRRRLYAGGCIRGEERFDKGLFPICFVSDYVIVMLYMNNRLLI